MPDVAPLVEVVPEPAVPAPAPAQALLTPAATAAEPADTAAGPGVARAELDDPAVAASAPTDEPSGIGEPGTAGRSAAGVEDGSTADAPTEVLLTSAGAGAPGRPSERGTAKRPPSPRPRRASQLRTPPSGSVSSRADGSPPGPEYTIKVNAGSKLFHPPHSPYYRRTRADFWFRSAEEARAAGFTEWTPKKPTTG